jgi:DNA-binding NarL/FixJ family response regulator
VSSTERAVTNLDGDENPEPGRIRVLVVSNDLFVRNGIRAALAGSDVVITGESATVTDGCRRAVELRPQVVVEALLSPHDSTDLLQRLRRSRPTMPVVVLATTTRQLPAALGAGAAGFVLTPRSPGHLVSAVRMVEAGFTVVPVGHAAETPCPDLLAAVSTDSPLRTLTRRELEVLVLIANGATNHAVARSLGLSQATVKSHVHRMLAKLELRNRVQAVAFAHDVGLTAGR